jgi:Uncharacterized protein conserved in bacteria
MKRFISMTLTLTLALILLSACAGVAPKQTEVVKYFMPYQYEAAINQGISLHDFSGEQKRLARWIANNIHPDESTSVMMNRESTLLGLGEVKFKMTSSVGDYYYQGDLKNNYANGFGMLYTIEDSGLRTYYYIGSFSDGRFEGYGLLFLEPDSVRIGSISPEEKGDYQEVHTQLSNYVFYEGFFKKGDADGKGNSYDFNFQSYYNGLSSGEEPAPSEAANEIIVGVSKNDAWNGKVKIYVNGILRYDGEMKNGEFSGKGKLYDANGQLQYSGEFKNGEYHGKGTLYDSDGKVIYNGEWKNGDYK